MSRLDFRNKPGSKLEWKQDKKHGKLTRTDGKGIDWWQYCTKIVLLKLIPFNTRVQKGQTMIIQEDGAAPHNSVYKNRLYNPATL